MFEFDVARGFNSHDVDQDVPQHHVVLLTFQILFIELTKLLLVHVSNVRVVLSCILQELPLNWLKSSSILEIDFKVYFSGATPSSKNMLIAFWMFHLAFFR